MGLQLLHTCACTPNLQTHMCTTHTFPREEVILCVLMMLVANSHPLVPVLLHHMLGPPLDVTILVGTLPFPVTVPHKVILYSSCFITKVLEAQGMCLALGHGARSPEEQLRKKLGSSWLCLQQGTSRVSPLQCH